MNSLPSGELILLRLTAKTPVASQDQGRLRGRGGRDVSFRRGCHVGQAKVRFLLLGACAASFLPGTAHSVPFPKQSLETWQA